MVSLCSIQAGNPGATRSCRAKRSWSARCARSAPTRRTSSSSASPNWWSRPARAFGAEAKLVYERIYPATINHAAQARFAGDVAAELVGEDNVVRDLEPSMGAEDFSFMLRVKPGCYVRLGQGGGAGGCFLHNTRYDFNDAVIPLGAAYFSALAERSLSLTAQSPS